MPSPRFRCPHCHASVDPAQMELATSRIGELRICPECDEPIPLGERPGPLPEKVDAPVQFRARVAG